MLHRMMTANLFFFGGYFYRPHGAG
ncbi:hypothetical protein OA2633_02951 [Oceanicaulis sp. HTCC2633]|nr:hypothetical protein OA2633_02951 [Oceanicaulis sp. HTCC2633]